MCELIDKVTYIALAVVSALSIAGSPPPLALVFREKLNSHY